MEFSVFFVFLLICLTTVTVNSFISLAPSSVKTRLLNNRRANPVSSAALTKQVRSVSVIALNNAETNHNEPQPQSKHYLIHDIFSSLYHLLTSSQSFFRHWLSHSTILTDPDLISFVAKCLSYGFWVFLTLIGLGTFGVDIKPLLSLVSVAGITIGLAAKDMLSHSFAGFYILFMKPFARGDVITVSGYTGKVTSINMRYVTLISKDGKNEILIPISQVYGQPISIEKRTS
jgi:small-conductance mechanosensitive channel